MGGRAKYRVLAALLSFLSGLLALGTSTSAQSIKTGQDTYALGDTISVEYAIPDFNEARDYSVSIYQVRPPCRTRADCPDRSTFLLHTEPIKGPRGVLEIDTKANHVADGFRAPLNRSHLPFIVVELVLYRGPWEGSPGGDIAKSETQVRIARVRHPKPGAITLVKGDSYKTGETMPVRLALGNTEDWRLSLTIFRLGQPVRGESRIADKIVQRAGVERGSPTRDIAAPNSPGLYEVRLLDHDHFVIDSARFRVNLEPVRLNIRIGEERIHGENRSIALHLDPPGSPTILQGIFNFFGWKPPSLLAPQLPGYATDVEIDIERRPSSTWSHQLGRVATYSNLMDRDRRITRPIEFRVNQAGSYRASAYLRMFHFNNERVLAGTLDFELPTATLDVSHSGVIGLQDRYEEGQSIEATVSTELTPAKLILYSNGTSPERQTISEWEVESPGSVQISRGLKFGYYDLSILPAIPGTFHGFSTRFAVVPRFGTGLINFGGRSVFTIGQPMSIRTEVRDNVQSPYVALFRLRGPAFGCLEGYGVAGGGGGFVSNGRARLEVKAPDTPGDYEARLIVMGSQVLATKAFSVEIPALPDALSLTTGRKYAPDQSAVVEISLPNNAPDRLHLQLFRLGDVSIDGATRHPFEVPLPGELRGLSQEPSIRPRFLRHRFKVPSDPGRYEVRLVRAGGYVLTRQAFEVVDPIWHFGLDINDDIEPPTDLPGPNDTERTLIGTSEPIIDCGKAQSVAHADIKPVAENIKSAPGAAHDTKP